MHKGKLRINGWDAWEKWGVVMGDGFIDSLLAPPPPKPAIRSSSRLENGIRMILRPKKTPFDAYARYIDSRDLTLMFNMHAVTERALVDNRAAFLDEMLSGWVDICVPSISEKGPYRLVWTGLGTTFSVSLDRRSCRMMLKFTEPNPTNRGFAEVER